MFAKHVSAAPAVVAPVANNASENVFAARLLTLVHFIVRHELTAWNVVVVRRRITSVSLARVVITTVVAAAVTTAVATI